jgi:hypothetical protein
MTGGLFGGGPPPPGGGLVLTKISSLKNHDFSNDQNQTWFKESQGCIGISYP